MNEKTANIMEVYNWCYFPTKSENKAKKQTKTYPLAKFSDFYIYIYMFVYIYNST